MRAKRRTTLHDRTGPRDITSRKKLSRQSQVDKRRMRHTLVITNAPSLPAPCCPGFPNFVHSVELSKTTFLRAFDGAGPPWMSICDWSL